MRTMLCAAVFGMILACAGCAESPEPKTAPDAAASGGKGNVDPETGNLIAFWLVYQDREEPVLVTEPYAVYLEWFGDVRRFYIYDNQAKHTVKAKDFDEFLKRLQGLPEGIAIQRFDTCTVSRLHDLPKEHWQRLKAALNSGRRKWAISRGGMNHEIICYCETVRLRFP